MKLLSSVIAASGLFSVFADDKTGPIVSDFTYTKSVEVESFFTASITLSDPFGVDRVSFNAYPVEGGWWYPCQQSSFALVNGTVFDGTWGLNCFISSDTPSQNYAIAYTAYDTVGNSVSDSYRKGFAVIGGPVPESNPPVIKKVTFDEDVTAGTSFTASLTVTDESGMQQGYMVVRSSVGSYAACTAEEMVLISGSAQEGVWTATCTIPSDAPNGGYWLEIHVHDTQKNPTDDFIHDAFTLHGGSTPDLVPPSIQSIKIDDTTVTYGQTLHVTAQISDSQSGVNYVYFYAMQGYTSEQFCKENMKLTAGDMSSGTWEISCEVPEGVEYAYFEASIMAYDNQNNVGFKTASFQVVPASSLK